MKKLTIPALTLALLAGCASMTAGPPPAMMKDGMLVNANGMTLYTFDRDVAGSGKSACNGDCAARWPAALASDSDRPSGDYTIVVRDNGQKQWAYRGKPLYLWVQDQKPGDRTGDNFNKVWHIVQ
jgi:predicted lipoprotein with Yx(FWY)xxD motif